MCTLTATTCRKCATGSGTISKRILTFNSGSSSLKLSLLRANSSGTVERQPLWTGQLTGLGTSKIELSVKSQPGIAEIKTGLAASDFDSASGQLLTHLWAGPHKQLSGPDDIPLVGHRVVHGGKRYTRSTVISDTVLGHLRELSELAPIHEEANIRGIETCQKAFPRASHVAVFDTAFHQTMPEHSFIYPVPYSWYASLGIRRYGFHGISHSYCAKRAAEMVGKELSALRIVTCHLGGGASLAAIAGGACRMTTMGFTPMEGVMMGTRSGSIDPGILLHLLQEGKYTADDLLRILNQESGLKGVSGLSADMREVIEASRQGRERARLALSMYIERLVMHVGALLPVIGGMDVLVFTGGVGENSPYVRKAACEALDFAGAACDNELNERVADDTNISAGHSKVAVLAVKAREDLAIAGECLNVLP